MSLCGKMLQFSHYIFLFHIHEQEAWWFHHMLIWMKKCLCKQACNTLSHSKPAHGYCNMIFYPAILSFSIAFTAKRMILYGWDLFEKDTYYE